MYSFLLWVLYYISGILMSKGFYNTGIFNIRFQYLGAKEYLMYLIYFLFVLIYSFLYSILAKFTISEFVGGTKRIAKVKEVFKPSITIFIFKFIFFIVITNLDLENTFKVNINNLILFILLIIGIIYYNLFILNMIDEGIDSFSLNCENISNKKIMKKYILSMLGVSLIISILFYGISRAASVNTELIFGSILEVLFVYIYISKVENQEKNSEINEKIDEKNYIYLVWFLILLIILPHLIYRVPSQAEVLSKVKSDVEKKI